MTAVMQAISGLKIVDFGAYAAGPHIGKLLANYGAVSVHVESHERPDGFRLQYPPFAKDKRGINRSGCFSYFNDSKYGVSINLKMPEGVELARRLASWADIVIENMRPGVISRLGLGYATLVKANSRLVMLSTCNMGQTGPRSDTPGFGSQLSALAGMCGMTGFSGESPMLLYGPYIDFIASSLGAAGVLAAVLRARRTGKGAYIDLSQYECGLTFMAGALHDYLSTGHVRDRCGNEDPEAVPHGAFPCLDREWVALSCWSDAEFSTLAHIIDRDELRTDPMFATNEGRRTNQRSLDDIISAWTQTRSSETVAETLQQAGICAYPVVDMAGLFCDPQLKARRQWRVRRHSEIGDQAYCFPGFDLMEAPGDIVGSAPCLGENNEYVFRDLIGLDESEMEKMRKCGVFD